MGTPSKEPDLTSISYDAILEDVFGLNIRGLKSLWQSFRNPGSYFRSALSLDWENKFTPAFRLWFFLVAVTFFFQFFWAGTTSSTLQNAVSQIEATGSLPDGVSAQMAAKEYIRWSFGFLPFILVLCLFILAAVYRAWGEKLSFAVRQRKLFITIIPSTFATIFATIALGFISGKHLWYALGVSYATSLFLDSFTAYRGAFAIQSFIGKLWRSIILGVSILITSLCASLLSNIAAGMAIMIKYS